MVGTLQYKPRTIRVLELRRRHPEWPLSRIGDKVGLSRERVCTPYYTRNS
ncbi:sigma factor-like helix-turn-helix DNA-binding protein [Chloroflexota bacterium]